MPDQSKPHFLDPVIVVEYPSVRQTRFVVATAASGGLYRVLSAPLPLGEARSLARTHRRELVSRDAHHLWCPICGQAAPAQTPGQGSGFIQIATHDAPTGPCGGSGILFYLTEQEGT